MKLRKLHRFLTNIKISKSPSTLLFFTFYLIISYSTTAQVSITQLGTPYTTNFNTLGNVSNATLPTGFLCGGDWASGISQTVFNAGTAGVAPVLSGVSAAGFYNLGNGSTDTATDRSLGFIFSTAYRNPRSIIMAFTNNTGVTVSQLSVSWNYEKYRSGGAAHFANLFHGTTNTINTTITANAALNAATFTVASSAGIQLGMAVSITSGTGTLNQTTIVSAIAGNTIGISPAVTGAITSGATVSFKSTATTRVDSLPFVADANSTTIYNPPLSYARTVTINSLNIPNGSTYYLRWMISGSSSASPALGIDDVVITAGDGRCYPYAQARMDSITSGPSGSLNVNYTRGNGSNVLIVATTSSTPTAPVNNTSYTANTAYGSGTAIGSGFVVYNGPGNGVNAAHTVNVTNLNSSTPYYFYIYEYNNAGICYHPNAVSGNAYFTAANDYFRSRTGGTWNDPNTWESSCNNTTWTTATAKPTNAARGITIRDSVSITTTAETARLLTINAGAKLTYITAAGYTGGNALTIADDPSGFDFNIYGTYIIFGNPATLETGATVKVFAGGLVRADANQGGLSDNFAANPNVYFTNGATFEWNTGTALNGSNTRYFVWNNAQPANDIATFKFSKAPAAFGGASPTVFYGLLEVNPPVGTGSVTFQGTGTKTIRNGIIGSGTLNQNTGGQIIISDSAIFGGTGVINLNSNGLKIAATSYTRMISDKVVNSGPVSVEGTLNMNDYVLSSIFPTSFTLVNGGTLGIGSPNGINTAPAASGNVQVPTRTFNAGGNFWYNGTANQVTGTGLPAAITGSLIIANTGAAGNNVVTLTTSGTMTDSLSLAAGLFAAGTGGTLQIQSGGWVTGNGGNMLNSPAAGTIYFPGTGTVAGSATGVDFYNVLIAGGVNFGSSITSYINNQLQINTGGWVNTNAPVYNTGSTLIYNPGGVFLRGAEFSTTTGKGYPFHVLVTNNTILDVGSSSPATVKKIAGNLTIDAGAQFAMDYLSNDMTANMTVMGDVNINGTLNLSDLSGGDLALGGNWIRAAAGIFNHKKRAVIFNGQSSNQTITVTGGGIENFGYLIVNKLSTTSLVLSASPSTDITVNGGNGGNAFQMLDGNMDLNGRTVNFVPFNTAVNNIGIDGVTGNTTRRISSTIAGGVFNIYNADPANSRVVNVNRQSAAASLLSFSSGTTLIIGGLSQNSGINFGGFTFILGTLQINTWGYVEVNPPFYGSNSNLVYNSGGSYKRYTEWSSSTGAGYPFNITIQNNTQLRINDDGPGQNGTADRALAGTLTIQAGATATLGDSTENNKLTIGKDLVLNGTLNMPSSITAIGADLYIAGNWNRSATGVFNHNERAVFFNGATNSTITAVNGQYFPYLYLQKAAATNTLSLLDNISIGKIFTINAGKFDLAGKDATLLSTSTATAQFGQLGANGDVLYSGVGRFVVERYLPTGTGAGQHGKSWQLLAIPTNGGQTINQAWQEGASTPNQNLNPGYGTQITSNNGGNTAGATALGFDVFTAAGPSMKIYNTNGTWTGVANTRTQPIYDPRGYMVFVRGDRSVTAFNQPSTSTTLRTRGKLFVPVSNPPASINIPAGSFQSLGNPYASAIDFTLLDVPGVPDVDPVYYAWDPLLSGTNGVGGYQTFSANNPVCDFCAFPGGTANYSATTSYKSIQSGQAFLMHATGAGGTVTFSETAKVAGSSNPFRGTPSVTDKQYLQIYLHSGTSDGAPVSDATSVVFSNSYSNSYDQNDALKLLNSGENLAILLNGKKLAIETRANIVRNDSILLDLTNLRRQTYQFRLIPGRFSGNEMAIQLIDRMGQATTSISTSDTTLVNFEVTADPASYQPNRFYLVFGKSRARLNAPVGSNLITKSISKSTTQIKPSIAISPNRIQDGTIHLMLQQLPEGHYAYTIIAGNGQQVSKGNLSVGSASAYQTIQINQLPKGTYRFVLSGQNNSTQEASFLVL